MHPSLIRSTHVRVESILWHWLGDISGGIFQQRAVDMERIISFGLASSVNNFYQRDLRNERRCSNTEVQHSSDSGGIWKWAVNQTKADLLRAQSKPLTSERIDSASGVTGLEQAK